MEESNVLVAVRVRPMNQKEITSEETDIVRVEDNLIVILDPIQMEYQAENKKMLDVYHRSKEQCYAFDKVFRQHSQEEIYEMTCKNLIKPVINGYNATVFAYGPTGTGKTYTMLGNSDVFGLSLLTIKDIFEYINRDEENEYNILITYVEIYNESIRDLLVVQSQYLELRDDPIKGVMISGVTEYQAQSSEEVMTLLQQGNKRRTTESTNANQTSSRSHAVFQILASNKSKTKNTEFETLIGKLSLIDLAGSERGTVTENRGLRLREGAKINRSLLALANCINALGDKSKKGFFVPYRDSKLTRLLKDSLGGNCKTVMIANISPSGSQFEETINTLKYANRAKNIKTKQVANKKLVALHIAEYKNIINDLRNEIDQLKQKLYDRSDEQNHIGIQNQNQIINIDEQLINNYVGKQNGKCTCNYKQEDEGQMRKIQETIYENFQERIQLRRALMEIEEQNAMNYLEIKTKQIQIAEWRKTNNDEVESVDGEKKKVPENIKQNAKAILTLKTSSDKNMIKKELMGIQLIENINNARRIRESIQNSIQNKDKKDLLELGIKNHVLELQNIELEINLQIQEKTISDLKNIIENQKKLIDQNNYPNEEEADDIYDQDHLLDDLIDEEDVIDVDPYEEDEDLNELENIKEIVKSQLSNKLNHQKQTSPEQKQENIRGRDIDLNSNFRVQRDRSANNNKKQQQLQQKQLKQSDELNVNSLKQLENYEDNEQEANNQNKQLKKRDDSKMKQTQKGNQQLPSIPNFVVTNQANNQQQLQQQIQITQNQNNTNKQNPKAQQQQNQKNTNQTPSQPDLSLNLKGNNIALNNQKMIAKPPKKK